MMNITVYLLICFNNLLVIYVAHAVFNDSKNGICHFNLSCQLRASCKIITFKLEAWYKMSTLWHQRLVLRSWMKRKRNKTWTSRWSDINHTQRRLRLFALLPWCFTSHHFTSLHFTFWYILISSTVHQSFKLVVLKFLLVMCRRWNLEIFFLSCLRL